MSTAADAGTTKARSEPNPADAWPVSHGTRDPPEPALENTQPLLWQASKKGEAKDKVKKLSSFRTRTRTTSLIWVTGML